MSASILGHLTLGYQWIWGRQREIAAVQIFVQPDAAAAVDAAHLLDLLAQNWSGKSPQLILTVASNALLADLLQRVGSDGPWLTVQDHQFENAQVSGGVDIAQRRGLPLLWRAEPGARIPVEARRQFARSMVTLSAGEALLALHAARHSGPGDGGNALQRTHNPVLPEQIYEGLGSSVLVDHCLDRHGAWGIAGWPVDDVAHGYRGRSIGPHQPSLLRLLEAVDADASMDVIEQRLTREPLLVYRFLRFANSAAFTLRNPIDSLRHGLMILGLGTFRNWLTDQLTTACTDPNLQPVRHGMVVRAQLMEQLLDAGEEDALRREIILTGLLSQIDLLVDEPLNLAMQRVPVAERVLSAVVSSNGPYAPFLQLAAALEYPGMRAIPDLCALHGVDLAHVNRTLLRVLAQSPKPLPVAR
ncbi:MAG: HDOD domain-containing protein [Rhodoferax sp.]|nr:HDOD domain-containing protein [Rhodoferax sp.]